MSNDLPPYDPKVFELMKYADSLPKNRRGGARRQEERRRDELNLSSRNLRQQSNRRQTDRREIVLSLFIKRPPEDVFNFFAEPENLTKVFPEVKLINVESVDTKPQALKISWGLMLSGSLISWTNQVSFNRTTSQINFKLLEGNFKKFDGKINLYESNGGTRIVVETQIDFGLSSIETFLGHAIKRQIEDMVFVFLRQVRNKLEESIVKKCDFAFLVHTIPEYFSCTFDEPFYKDNSRLIHDKVLSWLPPFKCAHMSGIRSLTGREIEGALIYVPLTPYQIQNMGTSEVFRKVIEGCQIGKELGAKIIGLGAYLASVGRRGLEIQKVIKVPVTTGTAYTIAVTVEAILHAVNLFRVDLGTAQLAIIGAAGTVGRTIAELMAKHFTRLLLISRSESVLKKISISLQKRYKIDVSISSKFGDTMYDSDLVVVCTNTPYAFLSLECLKPGCIVCDVSQPRNISYAEAEQRPDILVIDGGIVYPPGSFQCGFYYGLQAGAIYACMAETMILALENRFESFSIGSIVCMEKVEEIRDLAKKHGFKVADLKSFGKIVTKKRVNDIIQTRNLVTKQ